MDKLNAWIDAFQVLLGKAGRLGALFDKSAWLLMLPALGALYATDEALTKTLVQWCTFAMVLAGAAIIISRVTFPQIDLTAMVEKVKSENSMPAAVLCLAVVIFVSSLMIALVMWAKGT
jgi:hypothetical protein